jgi:hypothetical protein
MKKQFSQFAKETILDGDKIKLDDILNQEIEILAISIKTSKYKDKDYLTIQLNLDDKKHVLFTGSEVLASQLSKYKTEIPFFTTIRKINKYYSLT